MLLPWNILPVPDILIGEFVQGGNPWRRSSKPYSSALLPPAASRSPSPKSAPPSELAAEPASVLAARMLEPALARAEGPELVRGLLRPVQMSALRLELEP